MMSQLSIPQEVLLLICQELALRHDFPTLFRCALVSRRLATLALEQLYRIHERSPASTGETSSRIAWARLWKSIIRSSIGETAYPYCTYIRALSLGNFEDLLTDVWNDHNVRPWLFDSEEKMDQFLVLRDGQPKRQTRNQVLPPMDVQSTLVKCADSITCYIKQTAVETETVVSLAHLEANRIPVDVLSTWIMRLGTLTSLRMVRGNFLTAKVASAIYESCPKFSDLTCLSCDDSDSAIAAFLQTLRPNTLQQFKIISMNHIEEKALTALNSQAESLKFLTLGSLSGQAMKSLNLLPSCTKLETLSLENRKHDQVDLKTFSEGLVKEIMAWVQNCTNLQDLTFTNVKDALLIVKDVLNTPSIQLKSLSLQGFTAQGAEHDSATWAALGLQSSLESLTIGGEDSAPDGLVIHDSPPLADSICKLQSLRTLNLMQAFVRASDIKKFAAALPNLTELSFSGEYLDDGVLRHLTSLQHLKVLGINAFSIFTFPGLREFAMELDPSDHKGIRVDILNQIGEWKLSEENTAWLANHFTSHLEGAIQIQYFHDPDELHESDFSAMSD